MRDMNTVLSPEAPLATGSEAKPVVYDLPIPEIRENIALRHPQLLKEVFEQARAIAAEEALRSGRLDLKANTLLAVVGLLGALVTVFLRNDVSKVGVMVLAAGTVPALVALAFAVKALLVRQYSRVPDTALFSKSVLDSADEQKDEEDAVAEYRRFILPAIWEAHQTMSNINDERAKLVEHGQKAFFVAVLVPTIGSILVALFR